MTGGGVVFAWGVWVAVVCRVEGLELVEPEPVGRRRSEFQPLSRARVRAAATSRYAALVQLVAREAA